MKSHLPLATCLSAITLLLLGCLGPLQRPAPSTPTAAIAIRLPGRVTPTPAQATFVYQALDGRLKQAGWEVARNAGNADYIIHVAFTPDASDPSQGHVTVTGVEKRIAQSSDARQDAQQAVKDLEYWGASRAAPGP